MKNNKFEPEFSVIEFKTEDVICTSDITPPPPSTKNYETKNPINGVEIPL